MPRKSNKSNKIRAQMRDKAGLWCVSENNEEEGNEIVKEKKLVVNTNQYFFAR